MTYRAMNEENRVTVRHGPNVRYDWLSDMQPYME